MESIKIKSTFYGYDGKAYPAVYTIQKTDNEITNASGIYQEENGDWVDTCEDQSDIIECFLNNRL